MQPQFSYELLSTCDGSPTLRLWKENQPSECMHHSGGALTESVYIYFEALKRAYDLKLPIRVLSLGTGLGYNEMLTAAFALKNGLLPAQVELSSYESEDYIRSEFMNWIKGTQSEWTHIFDLVSLAVCKHFGIQSDDIRKYLAGFDYNSALTLTTEYNKQHTVVFFDSFSSKATPDLWTDELLTAFLTKACAKSCVLSTYAAKGTFRRALKAAGFSVEKRPGFFGKRDSTMAVRI